MSTKTLLWLIVGVAVIGGGFWYFSSSQGGVVGQGGPNESENQDSQSRKITGSIDDLLAEGESYRCSFVYESDLADSTGVVYVSGGKLKGDFETDVAALGQKIVTHMVRDGVTVYTWIEGTNVGVKAPATISQTDSSIGTSGQASFDPLSQNLEYDCQSWVADPGVFILPAEVKFTEAQGN